MKRITRRHFLQLSGMASAAMLTASTGTPEPEPETKIDTDTLFLFQTGLSALGIGTETPSTKLHIVGDALIEGADGYGSTGETAT